MSGRRWKFWGWGLEGDGLDADEQQRLLDFYTERFGARRRRGRPPPSVEDRPPAAAHQPPAGLAAICTSEPYERLLHSYGKSFPSAVRIFARDFSDAPDVVARRAPKRT